MMMTETAEFVGLNLLLALTSCLSFVAPLRFGSQEGALSLLNAYSCGLLVGCALCVILPEGFEHGGTEDGHGSAGIALLAGYVVQLLFDVVMNRINAPKKRRNGMGVSLDCGLEAGKSSPVANEEGEEGWAELATPAHLEGDALERDVEIDKKGLREGSSLSLLGPDPSRPRPVAVDDGGAGPHSPSFSHHHHHHGHMHVGARSSLLSTFTGLLVHCAGDGLALGASSLSSSNALRWGVFIALTIHKAPVAFATGSLVLNHQRQLHKGVQPDLLRYGLAFSLTSPLCALAVYFVLHGGELEALIGQGLLFSGGTFLYIIGHMVPELLHSPQFKGPQWILGMVCLFTGMSTLPLLLSLAPDVHH